MAITPLPPAPLPSDTPAQFNEKAFDLVAALDTFVTETNATATAVDADRVDAEQAVVDAATQVGLAEDQVDLAIAQVALATTQANNAEASANAAAAAAGADGWVSGTTYAVGDCVWSPIDYQTYRRKTAGAGTTDPSADATNWEQISAEVLDAASQAEMETGTEAGLRSMSPLRVAQAIAALGAGGDKTWTAFTSSSTYTVPSGVTSIRAYAFGGGGDGSATGERGGGGGGGCAFGDIAVTPGSTVTITINSKIATLTYGGVNLLVANPGSNAVGSTGGAGGTATKDASVTNGNAFSGGPGGTSTNRSAGGGASGSPLGVGGSGGANRGGGGGGAGGNGGNGVAINATSPAGGCGGGGGAGGDGSNGGGGGAGGPANEMRGGIGRDFVRNLFTDPLMAFCTGIGGSGMTEDNSNTGRYTAASGQSGQPGGGGGGGFSENDYAVGGNGGFFGGGGGNYAGTGGNLNSAGNGGFGGGGGGSVTGVGGVGGFGGGGGGGSTTAAGGGAIVLIYA